MELSNKDNTSELFLPLVIEDAVANCSFQVGIKEHENLTKPAVLENQTASTSAIEIEPEWDHFEIEGIPSTNFMYKQNSSEICEYMLDFHSNINVLKG